MQESCPQCNNAPCTCDAGNKEECPSCNNAPCTCDGPQK